MSANRELGPYRILDLLGSGGMGDVYRARDTRLKRDVALKILPDAFASNPDRLARFQREAEILASLNHPHIAAIHGIEESAGTRALVLELVEGETLAERIARGPIPVDEALRIATQIADALEAAHEHGIVHRDLKPANVKASPTGLVKVLDFGLAKAVHGGRAGAGPSHLPATIENATGEGLIVGTAAYMSPEQALGQPVDKRTDIWAFGCVLYEMLTGRAAFARSTIPESLASVLGGEPAWHDLPETTPLPIRRLLQRCVAKKVTRRLHDIADARIEIDDALKSPPASASPAAENHRVPRPAAGARTWRPTALVLGVVALVVGGLGLMVRDLRRPAVVAPNHEMVQFAIHLQPDEQFSIDTGLPVILATSPDGKELVYAARGAGGDRLYLRRLGDLKPSPIPGTEGAIGPFFSPDSQWIGFASAGMLRAVPVLGGAPRILAESANLIGASWGTRDTIVYGNWDSGLVKVSAHGGRPEALTTPDEGQGEFQHSSPHVLPDGTAALFTANRRPAQQFVEVVDFATRRRRSLIEGRNPIYLLSGHVIFARGSTLFAVPFDASSREITGSAIRLLDGIRVDGNDTHFAVAGDGTLVYIPELSRESRLVWYGRAGDLRPLDSERRRYSHPRISPDGTRVVLNVPRESGGPPEIWIYDAARGRRTRLSPTGSRPI
ncbi:MAG: protein kinase [Luteitalea sp.]|nr:protein kinase [Luteitalea sp.]